MRLLGATINNMQPLNGVTVTMIGKRPWHIGIAWIEHQVAEINSPPGHSNAPHPRGVRRIFGAGSMRTSRATLPVRRPRIQTLGADAGTRDTRLLRGCACDLNAGGGPGRANGDSSFSRKCGGAGTPSEENGNQLRHPGRPPRFAGAHVARFHMPWNSAPSSRRRLWRTAGQFADLFVGRLMGA